jgi:hypothetical protein
MEVAQMKIAQMAQVFVIVICCMSFCEVTHPVHAAQSGILVPDGFRHAEGGLVVQSVAGSHLEASFGGEQKAAFITTDKGVVEVVVLPGAMDAEQLIVTYSKWNGNGHHFYITGPTVRKPRDSYGSQFAYFTLHKNWFIVTWRPELDGIVKRILGQTPTR